jgi:hypothetical protein
MAMIYILALTEKPANNSFSDIVKKLFMPEAFIANQEGSEASKK